MEKAESTYHLMKFKLSTEKVNFSFHVTFIHRINCSSFLQLYSLGLLTRAIVGCKLGHDIFQENNHFATIVCIS